MKRINLRPGGPECSLISAGFWRLNEWDFNTNELVDFIEHCLESGISSFDHADIYGDYGNEAIFGKALKERPDLRDKMELITKCGICLKTSKRPENTVQHYNTTSSHIRDSVEQSLRNLHTEVIDLVLIHRPDPLMDSGEMADIFSILIEEEKIRFVGVSNFTPSQFDMFQSKLDHPLVTNQVECSLLHLDPIYDGTFDQAQQLGFSPMIWSPFAGGRLFSENSERANRVRHTSNEMAIKYGVSIDQISLAWLLALPCNPQPVVGTGKKERISGAAAALEVKLERQDWYKLLEASNGHPVP